MENVINKIINFNFSSLLSLILIDFTQISAKKCENSKKQFNFLLIFINLLFLFSFYLYLYLPPNMIHLLPSHLTYHLLEIPESSCPLINFLLFNKLSFTVSIFVTSKLSFRVTESTAFEKFN